MKILTLAASAVILFSCNSTDNGTEEKKDSVATSVAVAADSQSITYNQGNAFKFLRAGQSAAEVITYVMRDADGRTHLASPIRFRHEVMQ